MRPDTAAGQGTPVLAKCLQTLSSEQGTHQRAEASQGAQWRGIRPPMLEMRL